MKDGFRRSMAWLHTWGGLWFGWLLFTVFLTGTLAVFDEAITQWMRAAPAVERAGPAPDRLQAMRTAQAFLQKTAPQSHFWATQLPSEEEPAMRVSWEDPQGEIQRARLDPVHGATLSAQAARDTEGGHHFVHMHFELQAGSTGLWIVGAATMAMLVALISGIVTHRRFFKDFFTFRAARGQRSWLDAHNVAGVLTLPFQLMIAYTGLAVCYATYMPAGIAAGYEDAEAFFAELSGQPPHREEQHIAAAVTGLDVLLARAEARLQRPASFLIVEHAGDRSATVQVFGRSDAAANRNRLLGTGNGRMTFDGVTGDPLSLQLPQASPGGPASATLEAMETLHFAQFGGYALKWLYFVLGAAGTVLMATGCLLFAVKRRDRSLAEFGARTPQVYRLIDVLNVGVIAGLNVACIAYLWLNRLVPPGIEHRPRWEIAGFFAVWAGAFAHASLREQRRAWKEQLAVCALLCLTLPVLNWLTTRAQLAFYIDDGDWLSAGVELTVLALGCLSAGAALLVKSPQPDSRPARRAGQSLRAEATR